MSEIRGLFILFSFALLWGLVTAANAWVLQDLLAGMPVVLVLGSAAAALLELLIALWLTTLGRHSGTDVSDQSGDDFS